MKKVFVLFAFVAAAVSFAACDPADNPANDPGTSLVTVAAENLVVYMPLESAEKTVSVGDGITFAEAKGSASFAEGILGNGYINTTGDNMKQAFLKFNLASNNAFKNLESMTFSCWVKLNEACSKGAIMSVNGSGIDWPAFIAYFDNSNVGDDGVKTQQVNGRLVFHDAEGVEQNLWLDTWDPNLAKYGKWFQFAFTYDSNTGFWNIYVDGVNIKEAEFGAKIPVSNLVTASCNAMYVGGWSTFIEGQSTQDWQSYFAGSIDEIRVYNRVLSETEITTLRVQELAAAVAAAATK